jgi:FkbM family methyltransferase
MNLIDRLHMLHRFWRYRLKDESDYINFILKQDLSGTTVIDAGANRGIYSYWFSKKVGETGRVIAFEPQPELGLFLKDLKKTFNLKRLIIENKGLSDECGTRKLFRPEVGSGIAGFDERTGFEQIEVDVVCLDEYFKDQKNIEISFIKCDVEGHEYQVFMGAENI